MQIGIGSEDPCLEPVQEPIGHLRSRLQIATQSMRR